MTGQAISFKESYDNYSGKKNLVNITKFNDKIFNSLYCLFLLPSMKKWFSDFLDMKVEVTQNCYFTEMESINVNFGEKQILQAILI